MTASIKHLGEFNAHVSALHSDPVKRRRRLALLAGGAAVGGVAAFLTAPAAASALGAAVLGKGGLVAGASKLSAAVLSSKLTVSALGSYKGLRIAQGYFGDLQHFEFLPATNLVNARANAHQYVFINGFLSQDEQEFGDWQQAIDALKALHLPLHHRNKTIPFSDLHQANGWHLRWDAKHLRELQLSFTGNSVQSLLTKNWRRAPVNVLTSLADNAWHHAYSNARKAGVLLAEAIWQTPTTQQFTLVGHSLGARVAFHAMQHLHQLQLMTKQQRRPIRHAVLLGAAQGRRQRELWQQVATVCGGDVINCYSKQDQVLRWLYQSANLGMSRPAGRGEVPSPAVNVDCSDWVDSHTRWKELLPVVYQRGILPILQTPS